MEIKLEFLNIKERARKPKATIQRSGKLGFNSEAIELMGMKAEDKFKIAINRTQEDQDNLYLIRCIESQNENCENSVKISKAGDYFYLNLTAYFDDLHLEYEKYLYIYNIYVKEYNGAQIYYLKRRAVKPRIKEQNENIKL